MSNRFLKGIIGSADRFDTALPWARGNKRVVFIRHRKQRRNAA